MAIISVTGGKGGVGKTLISLALAYTAARLKGLKTLLVDLDVECPDTVLLVEAKHIKTINVRSFIPSITEKCTGCGLCARSCHSGALIWPGRGRPPILIPRLCSGCKVCLYSCPLGAITESYKSIGFIEWYKANNISIVVAKLVEGEEHVAPLVAYAKRTALQEDHEIAIIDCGAGSGSKISIAIDGSKTVVIVVEPTPASINDALRVKIVADELGVSNVFAIVNKATSTSSVEHVERRLGVRVVGSIPYDLEIKRAYTGLNLVSLLESNTRVSQALKNIALKLLELTFQD